MQTLLIVAEIEIK